MWGLLSTTSSIITIVDFVLTRKAHIVGLSQAQRIDENFDHLGASVRDMQDQLHDVRQALHNMGHGLFTTGSKPETSKLLHPIERELLRRGNKVIRDEPVGWDQKSHRAFSQDPEKFLIHIQRADRAPTNPAILKDPTYVAWAFEKDGVHLIGFAKIGMLDLLGVPYEPLFSRYSADTQEKGPPGLFGRMFQAWSRSKQQQAAVTSDGPPKKAEFNLPTPQKTHDLEGFLNNLSYDTWRSLTPEGRNENRAGSGPKHHDPAPVRSAPAERVPPVGADCWASGKFQKPVPKQPTTSGSVKKPANGDSVPWTANPEADFLRFENLRRMDIERSASSRKPRALADIRKNRS